MTWSIPTAEYARFRRNPIQLVVTQLRYHPILKVGEKVPDFQDLVRGRFPAYSVQNGQSVVFQGMGQAASVNQQRVFQFDKVPAESGRLALTTTSLSLESRRHVDRSEFQGDMVHAVGALAGVCGPVSATRLGVRYINVIDREVISAALGVDVPWAELVTSEFRSVPTGLATPEGTVFSAEIRSAAGNGQMLIRYGLLPSGPGAQPQFRLDVDSYVEGDGPLADVSNHLPALSDNIYRVFRAAAGPALLQWMERMEAPSAD